MVDYVRSNHKAFNVCVKIIEARHVLVPKIGGPRPLVHRIDTLVTSAASASELNCSLKSTVDFGSGEFQAPRDDGRFDCVLDSWDAEISLRQGFAEPILDLC